MKKIFFYAFTLAAIASFLYSCDTGETPENPQQNDPRDKFVGNWSCNETSTQTGNSTFVVTISLNTGNTSQIMMADFYHMGTSYKVYGVVADNYVEIPSQTVNNLNIRGNGNYNTSGTTISWDYYVETGADTDTCHAVFSK